MTNPAQPDPKLAAPSDTELRQALEQEKAQNAALRAEAQSYLGAARSEWARAEQAQAALREITRAPKKEDAFEKLGQEVDSDKQHELLDRGTRDRAREEVARAAQDLEEKRLADEYRRDTRLALGFFKANNPDIAQDVEGFAAALTKAQVRARTQRLNMDPVEQLTFAAQIYREEKQARSAPAPVGEVPYTERPGAPGAPMPMSRPPEPQPKTIWEELYGAKDVVDGSDPNWSLDSMTEQYLDRKNLELVKEGFQTKIGQVMASIEAAKQRRSAAA